MHRHARGRAREPGHWPPPYPGYVEGAEAAVRTNLDDPDSFVRHLKVVNLANEGEIMAYAKWELYPDGRSEENLEKLKEPVSNEDMKVDQYGALREAAHDYFCSRNGEMGRRPHLRTIVVTRPSLAWQS
jgi:hypothetical protein